MADKKESYTKLFNPILEEICKRDFTASELTIIYFVIRYTYGFTRKKHQFSVGYIQKGTGLSTVTIKRTINNLIDKNVLILYEPAIGRKPRVLGLNKHYSEWLVVSRVTGISGVQLEVSSVSHKTSVEVSPVSSNGISGDTQERKYNKEIINKERKEKSFTPIFNYTEEELEELRKEGYDV